ncbi:MAG: ABC transporter permease [Bacteroidetes bacterium]|nr:ABC transporter permease [Bacteroidota bacterium]
MRLHFIRKLAVEEFRSQKSRIGFLVLSVFLGVAALVAVSSFSDNLKESVELQSRKLKGSDLSFSANREFPDSLSQVFDSLRSAGMEESRITQFLSMAINPEDMNSRLVQVRAMSGGYPWYGDVVTEPADAWSTFQDGKKAVADESLRFQLGLEPGDSIKIGQAKFAIAGFVKKMAGDAGFGFGVSARVYLPDRYLPETGLIQYGSRVRYISEWKGVPGQDIAALTNRMENQWREADIRVSSYLSREQRLGENIDRVGTFLGLVSLIALLLGGIGVASSINVYIRQKMDTVAILRCLGATGPEVATIYLSVSLMMASAGIIAGVLAGIGIQFLIPLAIQSYLPVELVTTLSWPAILKGILTGLVVTVTFSLFPLSRLLLVSPLHALRRDVAPAGSLRRSRLMTAIVSVLFLGTLWTMSVIHAGSLLIGSVFLAGILLVLGVLYLMSLVIVRGARLLRIRQFSYPVRQSVSNLFRPNNQTVTLVLALGFGVFLLLTIYQLQKGLLDEITFSDAGSRPNLILFDIQKSQVEPLTALLDSTQWSYTTPLPLIPARVSSINSVSARSLTDSVGRSGPRGEFMATYRWDLLSTETITDGAWWTAGNNDQTPEVSLEVMYARRLGLKIGDQVELEILGARRSFTLTSMREVNWIGMSPNFMVVVKPGSLEQAPQTFLTSLHIDGVETRSDFQRKLAARFPNIMAIDLTLVIETVDSVLDKIGLVIRFMGLFSILTGLIVVAGAISNGKLHRIRETALLRTLGAVKSVIRQIFTLEFIILGALASVTGLGLSVLASQLILREVFSIAAAIPFTLIGNGLLITILLMTGAGWLINGNLFRLKPLEVLRQD